MDGSSVIAATNAMMIEMEIAGPILAKMASLEKTIARNVTATVAADAAITLPMDIMAFLTARSESWPLRT